MYSETSWQHGCTMRCKSAELNVSGYAGRSALCLHISRCLSFFCHISLAFISPDKVHTTLKLIILYGCGLHKSKPSTRMPTCSHAHSHRHVPTLPPLPVIPPQGSISHVPWLPWQCGLRKRQRAWWVTRESEGENMSRHQQWNKE